MKTARILITALALVATINAPLLANGRRACYPCYRPTYVAPAEKVVAQGAPAPAPNVSTTSTDNSVTHITNIVYDQLPAAQGQTLYGYNSYSTTNLGLNHYVAERTAAAAATIQSQAIDAERAANAEVLSLAKLQAKERIVTAALAVLDDGEPAATAASSRAVIQQEIHASGSVSTGGAAARGDNALAQRVTNLVQAKCVSCHGPTRQAGNLDLSNLANVDGAKVLARVTSADPTKRMPLGAGDVPGTPLSVGELSTLFAAVGVVE